MSTYTDREVEALPAVLVIAELARLLRCSPTTIRRRLADGVFPVAPVPGLGRTLRWYTADVRRWLERDSGPQVRSLARGRRQVA